MVFNHFRDPIPPVRCLRGSIEMVANSYVTLASIWQVNAITSLQPPDRTCLVTHLHPAKTECCLTLQILRNLVFPT